MLQQNKPIVHFLLKFLLCYTLLSLPFPFLEKGYSRFYRASCTKFFTSFTDNSNAQFSDTQKPYIMQIDIGNLTQSDAKKNMKSIKAETNVRYRGYIPTILLLSLVFATPLFWKRKLFTLGLSFCLLHAFIMGKQWMHLIVLCAENDWVQLYHFTPSQNQTLHFVYNNLITYMGPSFMVVVLIWVLISFKKADFAFL